MLAGTDLILSSLTHQSQIEQTTHCLTLLATIMHKHTHSAYTYMVLVCMMNVQTSVFDAYYIACHQCMCMPPMSAAREGN